MPPTLSIHGTRLLLDNQPFFLQGLSFFNALYNPAFNQSSDAKIAWLKKFKANGVNTLRVWCQWDFIDRPFVDLKVENTLYDHQGGIKDDVMRRIIDLIELLTAEGMLLELTLYSHEKKPYYSPEILAKGGAAAARHLKPCRNLILQIWNEESFGWQSCFEAIKAEDPTRLVTSSPGVANVLGDDLQNSTLDLLTPHTVRKDAPRFWEVAPQQIAGLIEKFKKPVIDDEPARNGTTRFGGIEGGTRPEQHIEQIRRVRAVGGYHIYHHDMFQMGYGHPSIPAHGIPDPDFDGFQRKVFDYLRDHQTW